MGINIQDVGITTVDGRTTNNPVYAVGGGSGEGIPGGIISSGTSRSKRNKKLELSTDDKLLQKQGYTILQITEHIGKPSKTLQPNSSQVRPEDYDILEKYKRSRGIHGL